MTEAQPHGPFGVTDDGSAPPTDPPTEPATFLFCDMVGSTTLLVNRGLAVSESVRQRLFGALREAIALADGEEVKNTGDGLMAVFRRGGVDDALACAVTMQRAMTRIRWEHPDDGVEVRIGLAAGQATFAVEELDWFGAPVNDAAHLCAAAIAGQILVDGSIVAGGRSPSPRPVLCGSVFLKGPGRVPVWSVPWDIDPERSLVPLPPAFGHVQWWPTVGRTAIASELERAWASAVGGEPSLVAVVGEAGVGTTSVVRELSQCVHRQGAIVIDGPAGVRAALARGGLPRAPTLVVFDDVAHLSASAILAMVAQLHGPERRVLVVVAGHRNPFPPDVVDVLTVEALAVAEAEALVRHIAGDVPRPVLVELVRRGRGVPRDLIELAKAVRTDQGPIGTDTLPRPPYRGLAPLGVSDHDVLFGRDGFVDAVLALVGVHPVVAVVGGSGVGKSSVLHAGLASWLASNRGSPAWRVASMRPGPEPRQALIDAFASVADEALAVKTVEAILTGAPDRAPLLVGKDPIMLLVDQFEELFTQGRSGDAGAFVDDLLGAATSSAGRLRVVLAIRSDFYGRAIELPSLAVVLQSAQLVLAPMDDAGLRDVVVGPARRAGLRVDDDLVRAVLEDVRGRSGALPLLSHALLETWHRRRGRRLTLDGYLESGGVVSAVAQTAEQLHDRLDATDRERLRALLLRMVEPDPVGDTRRVVSLDELPEELRSLVPRLIDARLVTADGSTIEVAHEALLRSWPRLVDWLVIEREGLHIHAHLRLATNGWVQSGRDPLELYAGGRLAAVERWVRQHQPVLNADEASFVQQSRRRSKRRARHRRGIAVVVTCLLAAAVASTLVAARQGSVADRNAQLAVAHAADAESEHAKSDVRELVSKASGLAGTQPDLALLLAREAHRLEPSVTGLGGLATALSARPGLVRLSPPDPALAGLRDPLSLGGASVVAYSRDRAGFVVVDRTTLRPTGVIVPTDNRTDALVTPGGTQLVTLDPRGRFQRWALATGRSLPLSTAERTDGTVASYAGSPGRMAMLPNGTVLGVSDGALLTLPPGAESPSSNGTRFIGLLASSDSGDWVALQGAGATGESLALVQPATGEIHWIRPPGTPGAAAFIDDEWLMVVNEASTGTVLSVVNVITADASDRTLRLPAPVRSIVRAGRAVDLLLDDGRLLTVSPTLAVTAEVLVGVQSQALALEDDRLIAVDHERIAVFDRSGRGGLVHDFRVGTSGVTGAIVAATPDYLLTYGRDGLVGVATDQQRAPGTSPIGLPDPTVAFFEPTAAVSADAHTAVLSVPAGTFLADLPSGRVRARLDDSDLTAVAFGPGGYRVAYVARGGPLMLANAVTGYRLWTAPAVATGSDIVWSPDASIVAVGPNAQGRWTLVDANVGRMIELIPADRIVFAPDSRHALILAPDLGMFDLASSNTAPLAIGNGPIVDAWFSPDGSEIATLSASGALQLHDAATLVQLGPPIAVPGQPGRDPTIADPLTTARPQLAHRSGGQPSSGVGFDGWSLYIGNRDGTAAEVELGGVAWDELACRIAGRNLTRDEWDRYLPFAGPYRTTCPEYPAPG